MTESFPFCRIRMAASIHREICIWLSCSKSEIYETKFGGMISAVGYNYFSYFLKPSALATLANLNIMKHTLLTI